LRAIGQKYGASHAYWEEVLRSLIHILLHETAPIYSVQHVSPNAIQMCRQLIFNEFKRLFNNHYAAERSPALHADKLRITPNYPAETAKETTVSAPCVK